MSKAALDEVRSSLLTSVVEAGLFLRSLELGLLPGVARPELFGRRGDLDRPRGGVEDMDPFVL